MNRKDLAAVIAERTDLTVTQADAALTAALDGIVGATANGERVSLSGFGTFERRHRAARSGRNPQTGQVMEIPASNVPAFKPATAFKSTVATG